MAKDDFHVIVYQILSYLYQCLKKGQDVDTRLLLADSIYFEVGGKGLNKRYWAYIIYNMSRLGLIEGVTFIDADNASYPYPLEMDDCMITPAGIEYLSDNAFISKAKEFLKDIKVIAPFV